MDPIVYILLGLALALGALWVIKRFWSFSAQTPADYAEKGPVFDIREQLKGPILCEGVIYGPTGRVTSRFVADFDARWEGDTGVMSEEFRYDSGTVQNREWRLTLEEGGKIRAEADDLVGTGSGQQQGSGVKLNYTIRLTEDAGGHALDVTDWMYLMDNGAIINRSQFKKFGLPVAELVATMRRKPTDAFPRLEAAE